MGPGIHMLVITTMLSLWMQTPNDSYIANIVSYPIQTPFMEFCGELINS